VSVPVGAAELRQQVTRYGPVAYLVTVAPDTGRPHVVSVSVRWDGEALVSGAGSRTSANLGSGADVSLVWSPPPGDDYSLIVDGPAEIVESGDGPMVSVRPTGSVLHRLAGAAGDGPGCIPVSTLDLPPTTDEDVRPDVPVARAAGADEHPNTARIRRFVDAWFDSDIATWTSMAADDIVLHMRGTPALDGDHRGHAGVTASFVKFATLGIDSFEAEAEDLIADDRFAMAIVRTAYQRGDETHIARIVCSYRFDDEGMVAEIWALSDSQDAQRAFFSDPPPSGLGIDLGAP